MNKKSKSKSLPLSELTLLSARIKNLHVQTSLYSAHKALDDAFAGVNDAMDSFIECVQGAYDDLPIDKKPVTFTPVSAEDPRSECAKMLKEFIALAEPLINSGDEAIDSALTGARDEITLTFLKLNYLLLRKN